MLYHIQKTHFFPFSFDTKPTISKVSVEIQKLQFLAVCACLVALKGTSEAFNQGATHSGEGGMTVEASLCYLLRRSHGPGPLFAGPLLVPLATLPFSRCTLFCSFLSLLYLPLQTSTLSLSPTEQR